MLPAIHSGTRSNCLSSSRQPSFSVQQPGLSVRLVSSVLAFGLRHLDFGVHNPLSPPYLKGEKRGTATSRKPRPAMTTCSVPTAWCLPVDSLMVDGPLVALVGPVAPGP
jgi:hypothetical protein